MQIISFCTKGMISFGPRVETSDLIKSMAASAIMIHTHIKIVILYLVSFSKAINHMIVRSVTVHTLRAS